MEKRDGVTIEEHCCCRIEYEPWNKPWTSSIIRRSKEELLKVAKGKKDMDKTGYQFLTCAILHDHMTCVERLIRTGAGVNVPGYTRIVRYDSFRRQYRPREVTVCDPPLLHAVHEGQQKCVGLLLQAGAAIRGPLNRRNTFYLEIYVTDNKSDARDEIGKMLLAAGASVNTEGAPRIAEGVHKNAKRVSGIIKGASVNITGACVNTEARNSDGVELCLKNLCRLFIRKRLVYRNRYNNLFQYVPQLGLPNLVNEYLLYHVSLSKAGKPKAVRI